MRGEGDERDPVFLNCAEVASVNMAISANGEIAVLGEIVIDIFIQYVIFTSMLKDAEQMKSGHWRAAGREALVNLFQRIPFARIEEIREGAQLGPDPRLRADFVVRLKIGQVSWDLIAELKPEAQPRQVRQVILQLKEYLEAVKGARYGVVVAPFISGQSAQACRDAGIGFLDLAGNAGISFDQVFIETHGAGNPFREKRELRSLFAPKALRILRVLLCGKLRPWKVTELAQKARVSLGQVSNVRKRLLDEEWAVELEGGVRISKPEELLKSWRAQVPRVRSRDVEFFTLDRQGEIEAKLADAGKRFGMRVALTELAGAARLAPMVRYLRTKAYVDDVEWIASALNLKRVDSGANVCLAMPGDDGAFYGTRDVRGAPVVSPVQVYADLIPGAGRQDEAAEALLEQVIRKEWATETS